MYVSWEDALKRSCDNEPIRVQRRMFAGFPREKLSINEGMSIAMFDYQRVGVMVVMALARWVYQQTQPNVGEPSFQIELGPQCPENTIMSSCVVYPCSQDISYAMFCS